MKDRIGNALKEGDKVMVVLPESQIFGFVSQMEEGGLIAGMGHRGTPAKRPGRILISCVLALPVDPELGMSAQLVKVYDADKHEETAPEMPN